MRKITLHKCGCDDKDCPLRLKVAPGMGYIMFTSTDKKGKPTGHVVGYRKIEKLYNLLGEFLMKEPGRNEAHK